MLYFKEVCASLSLQASSILSLLSFSLVEAQGLRDDWHLEFGSAWMAPMIGDDGQCWARGNFSLIFLLFLIHLLSLYMFLDSWTEFWSWVRRPLLVMVSEQDQLLFLVYPILGHNIMLSSCKCLVLDIGGVECQVISIRECIVFI